MISWCLEGAKEITEKAAKSSKKSKSKSSDSKFSDFIFPDRKSSKKSKDWNLYKSWGAVHWLDDSKKYNCQAETIIYTFIAFKIKKIKYNRYKIDCIDGAFEVIAEVNHCDLHPSQSICITYKIFYGL